MAVRTTGNTVTHENGADSANGLASKSAALRRYWWILLAVLCLAVVGALVSTIRTPTVYLGRTSLIVSSNDRSPEQDAVLVQGYVSYFDDAAYQDQLLAEAGLHAPAILSAQAAAASPILVITATAADPVSAQSDAIAVATVFKDDINEVHASTTAAALATLQDQLDTALARNGKDDQTVIAALQDRIRQLQADEDNVLQDLQSRGGVTAQPPSLFENLFLALGGGLFLGVLAALLLAHFSPRLRSRYDVLDKVGLNTLVELSEPHSPGARLSREQQLRQLANILRAKLAGPGVVAVTQPSGGAGTWVVARGLALEWAAQGYVTVLVRFGDSLDSTPLRVDGTGQEPAKPVEASAALSRMRVGPQPGMSILDLRLRLVGGARSLPAGKLPELLQLDPLVGAFVILEAPALVSSADAQSASLVADATILVIDPQVTKVAESRVAVELLRQSGVVPLGAVLATVDGGDGIVDVGEPGDGNDGQSGSWGLNRESTPGSSGWSW